METKDEVIRSIKRITKSVPTLEGAGVHLKRAFGNNDTRLFDPFLMMDDFRNTRREKFIKGFPWHPHRGIETITYILEGSVEHGDSMGNHGTISSGDVQWMTAGSGIIHQEMPKGTNDGRMSGFQLWANLPAARKMMAPRYQDIKRDTIPEIVTENGTKIKVICGNVSGISGPVRDIITDPEYLDIEVSKNSVLYHNTHSDYTAFVYVIGGNGYFDTEKSIKIENETIVLFEKGDKIEISTEESSVRFLLLTGKPLHEPIAWGGPIVMNTEDELQLAFEEYQNGTFIKVR
jgi:quercetin 2,3-dioxygenase